MFNMALLNSGFNIDEPSQFTAPLQKLINVGFGLDGDEPIEEIEVEVDEDEPEESADKAMTEEDDEEIVIDADTMTHTSSKDSADEDKDVFEEEEAPKETGGSDEPHDDL